MANLLKKLYETVWVPILGGMLILFSSWIEGEDIKKDSEKTSNNKRNR